MHDPFAIKEGFALLIYNFSSIVTSEAFDDLPKLILNQGYKVYKGLKNLLFVFQ